MNSFSVGFVPQLGATDTAQAISGAKAKEETPFRTMFEEALAQVEQTQAVKDADSVRLALGEVDDLGALMINAQQADVAVRMMVELRNKALDAYNEIMRINL